MVYCQLCEIKTNNVNFLYIRYQKIKYIIVHSLGALNNLKPRFEMLVSFPKIENNKVLFKILFPRLSSMPWMYVFVSVCHK